MEAAVQVVREGWFDLLSSDRQRLAQEVYRIPPTWIRDSALLTMLAGLVYSGVPHRRVKGLRFLVHATRAAGSEQKIHDALDRALILTSASVAYRLLGRPRLGIKAARSAVEILRRMTDAERDATHALPRVYAQLGTTLYYAGEVASALAAFEEGLAEIPAEEVQHGYTNLAMLAGIHALRGDIPQAESYLELARDERWPLAVRSMYPGTFYRIAEAVVALERFDLSSARHHLDAMVHDRPTIEHWIAIALTEARLGLAEGRSGAALAALDAFAESRQAEGRSGRTRRELAPMRALLQLALGSPDAALIILQRDAETGPAREIALARADLALARHGSALQRLRRVAGAPLSPRALAEFSSVEAAALLRFSERSRTQGVIQHLAGIMERTHQRFALILLPQDDYLRVVDGLRSFGHDALLAGLPETSAFPAPDVDVLLSDAEFKVLQGLFRTPSATAIAGELMVSVNTVKTQLRSVYRKLGVSTRDEAIAVALDMHLLLARRPDDVD
jgi:LuxR family maltose regulon positive regulatory protein